MVKALIAGLWACAVTIGSIYFGATWKSSAEQHSDKPAPAELVKLRSITVPVVSQGSISGYLLAVIGYNVDRTKLSDPRLAVEPLLQDETFRMLYGVDSVKYKKPRKSDLAEISKDLVAGMNRRLGSEFVKDVLIEELSFIPKEKVRAGRH